MKFFRIIFTISVIMLSLGIFVSSCTTTKKKGEVSKFGKAYKNMTFYYNSYYNADELYQNSLLTLNRSYQDDYRKILPIYTYRAAPNTTAVAADLDKVVEKMSRAINLKRVSDWVDDGYLLMGKAQYVKQDFEKAEHIFEFFSIEMNPSFAKATQKKSSGKNQANRKSTKKASRSRKNPPKTRTSSLATAASTRLVGTEKEWNTFNEGLIWLAKTYIERDKYASASYIINRLERENMEEELKKEMYLMKTYFFLRQNRYSDAVVPLALAISNTSSRQEKAHYSFILGQLYETLDNPQEAFKYFRMVGDLKPDYDLEFNAQLKLLRNYSGASDEYAMRELRKLLDEDKYIGFEDMIYFTMGEIHLRRNNTAEAVEGFNKSLRNNKNNNPLKADTYYYLADINFNNQDYLLAKKYYDSCLAVMPKTDERFLSISNLSTNLTGIAANLETITLQDSLIRISKMSKEEQLALATNIKKKQLEEEEKRKRPQQSEQSQRLQIGDITMQSGMDMPQGMQGRAMDRGRTSSFFAYNETAMTAGKQEFSRRWGGIRLEDNWRRSNKSSSFAFDDIETAEKELIVSDAELSMLLKGVPRNPDQLAEAEGKIRNAMLQLGILYREKLFNYRKSIDILEELLGRYSDFDQECEAMYHLQMSYKDLRNFDSAESWISKMSIKHPECIYTKILTDPDFVKNINRLQDTKADYYDSIFKDFNSGNYTSVQNKINNAPSDLLEDPQYKIKLDLISARLTGQIEGIDEYILALENFLKQYPQSQEAISVRETLRFLKGDTETFSRIIYEEEAEDFVFEPDLMHYIILLLKDVSDNKLVDEIKSSISRYNNTNHRHEGLKISNIYFDTKGIDQIILLRRFDNAETAMKYYNAVENNRSEFIELPVNFEIYAISQKNYREVIKQKTLENYRLFFNKNYMEK